MGGTQKRGNLASRVADRFTWKSLWRPSPVAVRRAADPLVRLLEQYDRQRAELETSGGDAGAVARMADVLTRPRNVRTPEGPMRLTLGQASSVEGFLRRIGGGGALRWQVRRLDSGLPAFHLCRITGDPWDEYRFVVEDLYCSPRYPRDDPRFIRLMDRGHETWFLHLSPYRHGARKALAAAKSPLREADVDRLLARAGRSVLRAAWHEDQIIGVLAAQTFKLPWFHWAIELLYLCLTADLCSLRREIDGGLTGFFDHAYPQPAVREFLGRLQGWDGDAVDEVPRRALRLYGQLATSFGAFLNTDVPSPHGGTMPLYKRLFANVDRLELVAEALVDHEAVDTSAVSLEEASQAIVDELLDMGG